METTPIILKEKIVALGHQIRHFLVLVETKVEKIII